MILKYMVLSLVLLAPASKHKHKAVPAPIVVPVYPSEVQKMIDQYCFPEIDPKVGGFWVIGPDGSVAYSPVSCYEALQIDDKRPAPVHGPDRFTRPYVSHIGIDKTL